MNIKKLFFDTYGIEPSVLAFAPGRVNLIGEHTDYNGGFVFPCALNIGIKGAARLRSDKRLRFYSANFAEIGITEINIESPAAKGWASYPVSVIRTFSAIGYRMESGADFVFCGDLPDGAGLSSSAALEVLTGILLSELYGFAVTKQELAVFGQFAENRFIGVNCGIMDQFSSSMGKRNNALLLNSAALSYTYAPFIEDEASIVLVNSRVKHSLASSAYNDRRRECESALADINEVKRTDSLCSITPDEFELYKDNIKNPVCRKRARHAVYENQRTLQAADVFQKGDLKAFGELMKQSHMSLRDDYEVSCAELDFLAQTAWDAEGVYGARMTGGGFGGCTVNIVRKASVQSFREKIKKEYMEKYGIEPTVYVVEIGDGAGIINEA